MWREVARGRDASSSRRTRRHWHSRSDWRRDLRCGRSSAPLFTNSPRRSGSARLCVRTSKYAPAWRVLVRDRPGHESAFRQCDSTPEGRATISGLHRPRPRRNSLPDRGLAAERLPRTARGDHLVLKRLSRHGGSPRGTRGCSCGGGAPRGRRWRHPQHLGYASSNSRARSRACRSSSKGSRACLHLRLAFEPSQHFDDRVFVAQLPDPFRRSQS
jgi:hypothetical protein